MNSLTPFLFSLLLLAQPGFAEPQNHCSADSYRQFDFWLGEWDVYSREGKKVGDNTISLAMNGCALKEYYRSVTGYQGESINVFDKTQQQWHQTWVDNTGYLLQLDGRWNGHHMVLLGEGLNANGHKVKHRITWKPQRNGDVHQIWEISEDRGLHWKTNFFGVYRKKQSPSSQN
jgi:hypothetical protein